MNEKYKVQIDHLEKIIGELEKAVAHAKIAKAHFESGEVPRACAHIFATEGHMCVSLEHTAEMSKLHRLKAQL